MERRRSRGAWNPTPDEGVDPLRPADDRRKPAYFAMQDVLKKRAGLA